MGTVVECSADFYHSRIPKKQRKQTLVDELISDSDFRQLVIVMLNVNLRFFKQFTL